MTSYSEKPGIEERYSRATTSSDLGLDEQLQKDADILLAAGMVAGRSQDAGMALGLYRMRATGDMGQFRQLAGIAGGWLFQRNRNRRDKPSRIETLDVATRTIFWWLNPACNVCAGLGHPLYKESPTINYTVDCPACLGTGKTPIHKIVPNGWSDEARWLTDEFQRLGTVFEAMKQKLYRGDK